MPSSSRLVHDWCTTCNLHNVLVTPPCKRILPSDDDHRGTTGLPLDELLYGSQVPYDDDESSEEETTPDDSSSFITSVVHCRWDNCRKMFKAGTYLCIDAGLFMSHIERDHVDPVHLDDGATIPCLWKLNECLEEVSREEILDHVKKHFKEDEYTRDAYPDPTLAPEQWVYCLWQDCGKVFADQDIGDIWGHHVWGHIQEEYEPTDATTKIACEWNGCEEDPEQEFGSRTIAQHVKKHLRDGMLRRTSIRPESVVPFPSSIPHDSNLDTDVCPSTS